MSVAIVQFFCCCSKEDQWFTAISTYDVDYSNSTTSAAATDNELTVRGQRLVDEINFLMIRE